MENKAGFLLAFALGAVVGYNWPTVKKTITSLANKVEPLASKLEKEVVKGYLTVKDGIYDVSGHFRKVADDVAAEGKGLVLKAKA